MSKAPAYPAIDPRRTTALRNALLRDIAVMAPNWRGAAEAEGPDRAVVEAAARLSEEATKRLDKTPERDALAFLDVFDIAPPSPVAAEGVVVFALKEDHPSPTLAPARTGVEIATSEGKPAPFETTRDLRIQPGRIGAVMTLDPRADKIEVAPGTVTTLEPDTTPRPDFTLLTAANMGDRTIMIDPPVGIEMGDLLRIGGASEGAHVYVNVENFRDDGLTDLTDEIAVDLAAGAKVERMTRLDAFAMPNAQEHALYIGDADILNVKERAEITLRLHPSEAAALLVAEGAIFEIWAINEDRGEESARWHRLVPLAGAGDDLVLYKAFVGPAEELDLGQRSGRWVRIRPKGEVTPDAAGRHALSGPDAVLNQITLGLKTNAPDAETPDETISQVAYNGLPLSSASAFLPFGPEPQRFDTFALAAPEAFTKPGARVTIDFTLLDATLLSLTAADRFDDERHLYGIGRNGRLQAVDIGRAEPVWREFAGPPEGEDSETTQALDPAFGVRAYGLTVSNGTTAHDRVVVRAVSGGYFTIDILHMPKKTANDPDVLERGTWQALPDLPDGAVADQEMPAMAITPRMGNLGTVVGFVTLLSTQGTYFLLLPSSGPTASSAWRLRPALPAPITTAGLSAVFDPSQATAPHFNSDPIAKYVAADAQGNVWLFETRTNAGSWTQLSDAFGPLQVDPGSQPVGRIYRFGMGGALRMAIAGIVGGHFWIWDFTVPNTGPVFQRRVTDGGAGTLAPETRLQIIEGLGPSSTSLPHVVAYQPDGDSGVLLEWAPGGASDPTPLDMQTGLVNETPLTAADLPSDPDAIPELAAFDPDPTADDTRALAVVAGASQSVQSLPIASSARARLTDWVRAWASNPPSEADEFTQIAILRRLPLTGAPDLVTFPDSSIGRTHPDDGAPIAAVDPALLTGTDFARPISVFRLASSHSGQYNLGGVLQAAGSTEIWFPGKQVLIDLRPSQPIEGFRGPFVIAAVPNANDLTLSAADAAVLDAVINDGDAVDWHIVWQTEEIAAQEFVQRRSGLVQDLIGLDGEPKQLAPYTSPTQRAALLALNPPVLTGPYLLKNGWPETPPLQNEHLKVGYDKESPPVLRSTSLAAPYANPELSWEYFDGEGWRRLGLAEGFLDSTAEFAGSGEVSFIVPDRLAMAEIGGQEDYWIRARLVGGDYGRPRYLVEQEPGAVPGELTQKVVVSTDHMRAPEIARLTSRIALQPSHVPQLVVARNNLRDLDQSAANRRRETAYRMFYGAFEPPLVSPVSDRMTATEDDRLGRSILIGFTHALEPGLISLCVIAADQDAHFDLEFSTLGADGAWSPAPLAERDETHGFTRSGLVHVSLSSAPAPIQLFGQPLHWLKVRATGAGIAGWAPRLLGIWPNGAPIRQTETVLNEPLGSSNGEPNQQLQLLKTVVLPETIELRVRERLGTEEVLALRAKFGADAVLDSVPNLRGQWVRWRKVDSLADQNGEDRVFLADANGKITFGDGQNGRLPLAGRDNLRAFSYQSGGQRAETDSFADAGLRGSLEGFETVLSPAAIAGGRDMPSRPELVARMSDALRHAGHGLSLSDIEAMARDIDSEIVQVRAFPPREARDHVQVSVLARGTGRAPVYSLARREQLARALGLRMSDAWPAACLDVQSVRFVPLIVAVSLVAKPGDAAALQSQAKARLDLYLDAARGGPDGNGWPPARPLWPTDIRRALRDLPALSRVEDVQITCEDGGDVTAIGPGEVIATLRTRDVTVRVVEGDT